MKKMNRFSYSHNRSIDTNLKGLWRRCVYDLKCGGCHQSRLDCVLQKPSWASILKIRKKEEQFVAICHYDSIANNEEEEEAEEIHTWMISDRWKQLFSWTDGKKKTTEFAELVRSRQSIMENLFKKIQELQDEACRLKEEEKERQKGYSASSPQPSSTWNLTTDRQQHSSRTLPPCASRRFNNLVQQSSQSPLPYPPCTTDIKAKNSFLSFIAVLSCEFQHVYIRKLQTK